MNQNDKAYFRICRMLRVLKALFMPGRVEGLENFPAEGPCILAINHLSDLDPFLVAAVLPRHIFYIAKQELFKVPVVGWFVRKMGAFPVDRGNADLNAIRKCIGVIREGNVLGIFPQGHRYKADDHRELQQGAALVALRTKVPVIPVHLSAPLRAFRRMTIRIGRPVDLTDLHGKIDSTALADATARITAGIWAE